MGVLVVEQSRHSVHDITLSILKWIGSWVKLQLCHQCNDDSCITGCGDQPAVEKVMHKNREMNINYFDWIYVIYHSQLRFDLTCILFICSYNNNINLILICKTNDIDIDIQRKLCNFIYVSRCTLNWYFVKLLRISNLFGMLHHLNIVDYELRKAQIPEIGTTPLVGL